MQSKWHIEKLQHLADPTMSFLTRYLGRMQPGSERDRMIARALPRELESNARALLEVCGRAQGIYHAGDLRRPKTIAESACRLEEKYHRPVITLLDYFRADDTGPAGDWVKKLYQRAAVEGDGDYVAVFREYFLRTAPIFPVLSFGEEWRSWRCIPDLVRDAQQRGQKICVVPNDPQAAIRELAKEEFFSETEHSPE